MSTKILSIVLSLIVLFTIFTSKTEAKSVYAITDHGWRTGGGSAPSKISAYDINSSRIDCRTTLTLADMNDYPTGMGAGPVALAIDSNSGCMFVTHESWDYYGHIIKGIQIIQTLTMNDFGWTPAPGAANLAGVVFDNDKHKLYTVDRGTANLFVYSWNSATKTLTLDGGAPKTLANIQGAGGLALDEIDDILYVTVLDMADGHTPISNTVYCYDTNSWSLYETINITVNGQNAMP